MLRGEDIFTLVIFVLIAYRLIPSSQYKSRSVLHYKYDVIPPIPYFKNPNTR